MRGLFVRRVLCSQRLNHHSLFSHLKPFCDNTKKPTTPNNELVPTTPNNELANVDKEPEFDPYKEVHNLDMDKALKIMASGRQRRQKFGIDWHLWQLFVSLLPSLAVYYVAKYARKEMNRRDAIYYEKVKADEEAAAKAKELELKAAEDRVSVNPVLVEVKVRLDKLEETIREIVVESKTQSSNLEDKSKLEKSKQEPPPTKPNSSVDSNSSSTATTKTSSNAGGDASKKDP